MPLQNPPGAADRPTMTAESTEPHRLALSESGDGAVGWRERIESMIERYPWPTLLLALSIGYIISRRMR